jgi:hypothetical protein
MMTCVVDYRLGNSDIIFANNDTVIYNIVSYSVLFMLT